MKQGYASDKAGNYVIVALSIKIVEILDGKHALRTTQQRFSHIHKSTLLVLIHTMHIHIYTNIYAYTRIIHRVI